MQKFKSALKIAARIEAEGFPVWCSVCKEIRLSLQPNENLKTTKSEDKHVGEQIQCPTNLSDSQHERTAKIPAKILTQHKS